MCQPNINVDSRFSRWSLCKSSWRHMAKAKKIWSIHSVVKFTSTAVNCLTCKLTVSCLILFCYKTRPCKVQVHFVHCDAIWNLKICPVVPCQLFISSYGKELVKDFIIQETKATKHCKVACNPKRWIFVLNYKKTIIGFCFLGNICMCYLP